MVDPEAQAERLRRADAGRREPVFNLPAVVTTLIVICVALELISEFALTDLQVRILRFYAAFVPFRYSGETPVDLWSFTTPVTYSLLHAGFVHVAVNMLWLAAFGSPIANRFGWTRFLVFWAVTSAAAAFFFLAVHGADVTPLVGASGAVSGLMGAAARYGFRIDRSAGRPLFLHAPMPIAETLRSRGVIAFLLVWFVVNLVSGFGLLTPGVTGAIAWQAHIGGFLAGFFLVPLFDRAKPAVV